MDEKRRDRMIAAFRELTANTERRQGKSYGTCRTCGAMVEWITTATGKKQAGVPNMGEPHIPHCGKQHWTLKQWEEVLADYLRREEAEENRGPFMTVPIRGGIKTIKRKSARKILKQWANEPNVSSVLPW